MEPTTDGWLVCGAYRAPRILLTDEQARERQARLNRSRSTWVEDRQESCGCRTTILPGPKLCHYICAGHKPGGEGRQGQGVYRYEAPPPPPTPVNRAHRSGCRLAVEVRSRDGNPVIGSLLFPEALCRG